MKKGLHFKIIRFLAWVWIYMGFGQNTMLHVWFPPLLFRELSIWTLHPPPTKQHMMAHRLIHLPSWHPPLHTLLLEFLYCACVGQQHPGNIPWCVHIPFSVPWLLLSKLAVHWFHLLETKHLFSISQLCKRDTNPLTPEHFEVWEPCLRLQQGLEQIGVSVFYVFHVLDTELRSLWEHATTLHIYFQQVRDKIILQEGESLIPVFISVVINCILAMGISVGHVYLLRHKCSQH